MQRSVLLTSINLALSMVETTPEAVASSTLSTTNKSKYKTSTSSTTALHVHTKNDSSLPELICVPKVVKAKPVRGFAVIAKYDSMYYPMSYLLH